MMRKGSSCNATPYRASVSVSSGHSGVMAEACRFCAIVRGESAASRVYEDDLALAFMNLRQANPGHVLVIPRAHVETIFDLDPHTAAHLFRVVVMIARAIRRACVPDGLNVWQSSGAAAGQEIPHVHIHLLPRITGDDLVRFYPGNPPFASRAQLDELAERIRAALA
jgi:histidine triad (HIT) family protein